MRPKTVLYYLVIGFLLIGLFIGETEARRKILRGRKVLTRRYYRSSWAPAWLYTAIIGISMLLAGGGLYLILKKLIIDPIELSEVPSYQPAMQDDV